MSIVKQGLEEMHIKKEVFRVLRGGFTAEMVQAKQGMYPYKLKTLLNNTQLTIGYWEANHLYVLWDDGDVMYTFYNDNKDKIEDLSISETKELFNQAQDLAERYNFDLNHVSEENFDFQMYCMIDNISNIFDIYVAIEMFKQDLRQALINLTK